LHCPLSKPRALSPPLSHTGSSRVTAISNVIPATSTWLKRAMVNSICSLVSILPYAGRRAEWQCSVNEVAVDYAASWEMAVSSLSFKERGGAASGLLASPILRATKRADLLSTAHFDTREFC